MTEASNVPVAPIFGSVAKGEVVIIAIGPEKKLYHIHKDLICHHSEYFRTAYNERWKEAQDGVSLEDVEVEVFNVFVHWLYMQQLPRSDRNMVRISGTEDSCDNTDLVSMLLLRACVFGDRFLAPVFQRLVHNRYIEGHKTSCGLRYTEIIWAYENFTDDSPILAFMVHIQCTRWHTETDRDDELKLRSQLPRKFLLDVMCELRLVHKSETEVVNGCAYHLHVSEEERKKCQGNVGK